MKHQKFMSENNVQNQLIINGKNITNIYNNLYSSIASEIDMSFSLEQTMNLGLRFENHILSTLMQLEEGLFGICECCFLDCENFFADYKTIKKCVEIFYSESVEVSYKSKEFFATIEGIVSLSDGIYFSVKDANNELFVIPLNAIHVNM